MAVDLTQPIKLGSPDYVEQQVIRKLDALGTSVTDPALEARVAQNESDISDLEIADTALDARLDAIEADYTTEAEADARVESLVTSKSFSITVADDAVWTFDFGAPCSAAQLIINSNQSGPNHYGIFSIRARTSPHCNAMASANITAATGAYTGTTGVDGAITVSTHTDNKVYLENRRGFAVEFLVTIISTLTPLTP